MELERCRRAATLSALPECLSQSQGCCNPGLYAATPTALGNGRRLPVSACGTGCPSCRPTALGNGRRLPVSACGTGCPSCRPTALRLTAQGCPQPWDSQPVDRSPAGVVARPVVLRPGPGGPVQLQPTSRRHPRWGRHTRVRGTACPSRNARNALPSRARPRPGRLAGAGRQPRSLGHDRFELASPGKDAYNTPGPLPEQGTRT